MKKSWIDQVKEREAAKEKQRTEEYLRAKEEEMKQKEEEEFDKLCQKRKEEEIKYFKQQIKVQMETIKLVQYLNFCFVKIIKPFLSVNMVSRIL